MSRISDLESRVSHLEGVVRVQQEVLADLNAELNRAKQDIVALSGRDGEAYSRTADLRRILTDAGLIDDRCRDISPEGLHLVQRISALTNHLGLMWSYIPGGWSLHPRKVDPEITGEQP
jgi:hypothetical protein